MRRFEGKVALVTGATTGIGQATAVRLAAEGAVVAVNQGPGTDPAPTLERIASDGGSAFAVVADMRIPSQVTAMVAETAARGGRLDYVVSNAAVNPFMTWDETSVEDFDLLFETNVRGPATPSLPPCQPAGPATPVPPEALCPGIHLPMRLSFLLVP